MVSSSCSQCAYKREAMQAALLKWEAEKFQTATAEAKMVATMMRSPVEWAAHPQGEAVAALPLLEITRIGEAPVRRLPRAERPLSGVRVLDLTSVIAGPVCGRTLAAHGADVMRITAPHLPGPRRDTDTGRGKLSAELDLRADEERERLNGLLREAHVFVQGYRPGGIAALGFSPEACAEIRPGIVTVSLSAYGHVGPWAGAAASTRWCRTPTASTTRRPKPPASRRGPRSCRPRRSITPLAI